MWDKGYVYVYNVKPILVAPNTITPITVARCPSSLHRQRSVTTTKLFEDTEPSLEHSAKVSCDDDRKSIQSVLKESDIGDDYSTRQEWGDLESIDGLSQSGVFEWNDVNFGEKMLENNSMKDASTDMNEPPEFETFREYFVEHPILDFIGNTCGLVALVGFLWSVFVWYVQLIEIS
ncbi:hypothetical protein DICVIV_01980 [Dictyocaulus viviparus]|uniref:Uncharacterized protein n=1 Tax=Dictyocaulus viviparus TaxID=29172 RepID=A0A0D8Y749_DICVI|nr:hypothetical protein DICVIV_01980 [Dictyocaulus viviparus]